MESTAFFEKKITLSPSEFNEVKKQSIDTLLEKKAKLLIENKCSEQGFVLSGSLKLLSRSMGYFESARFTGDAVYYVKLEGRIIYPADGIRVVAEVIRKNKMGLYAEYRNAIRIQVPRDLHIGSEEYENVEVSDLIEVELKRSKFQINDPYILASAIFISKKSNTDETRRITQGGNNYENVNEYNNANNANRANDDSNEYQENSEEENSEDGGESEDGEESEEESDE